MTVKGSKAMTLAKTLKSKRAKRSKPKSREPLWKGPEIDGITQSLLSRFLVCRERFRLLVVEGLRPADTFNHRIGYGQMWHVCEEALAKRIPEDPPAIAVWEGPLLGYSQRLCKQYPLQQEQIQHWYNVCKIQFPLYVEHWAKHKDAKQRVPLLQEQVFDVPYGLPSGRVVRLRGRWDSVDLIGKGRNAAIYLQENKTKGDIREDQIKRQLQFDLQTMLYLTALIESTSQNVEKKSLGFLDIFTGERIELGKSPLPVQGVRYNVVRRPLSGGVGSIRQHKATKTKPAETNENFYRRLGAIIAEDPGYSFMRWKVEITPHDVERFKREYLNPHLESLCDWWDWIDSNAGRADPFADHVHWRTPYGFYNVLAEGRSTELDEYLATGSQLGLEQVDQLFKELEECQRYQARRKVRGGGRHRACGTC